MRPLLEEPIALAAYEQRDGQVGFMLNPIGKRKAYKKNSFLFAMPERLAHRCFDWILASMALNSCRVI